MFAGAMERSTPCLLPIVKHHSRNKRNNLDRIYRIFRIVGWSFNEGTDLLIDFGRSILASKSEKRFWLPWWHEFWQLMIPAEPNDDLETEFATTVSDIQNISSESCFLWQSCRKTYKAKRLSKRDCIWIHLNSFWPLARWNWQMIKALIVKFHGRIFGISYWWRLYQKLSQIAK